MPFIEIPDSHIEIPDSHKLQIDLLSQFVSLDSLKVTSLNKLSYEILTSSASLIQCGDFSNGNLENFRFIDKQKHLFNNQSILSVNRYPQSKDLIIWLQNIPNRYFHFGDFDFEWIRIFKDEYFQYLKDKAPFFMPYMRNNKLEGLGIKIYITFNINQTRSTPFL